MPSDPSLKIVIENVYVIEGQGTVAAGTVASGGLKKGDSLHLTSATGIREIAVKGIEKDRKLVQRASVGDKIGVLLEGVAKNDISRGDLLLGALQSPETRAETDGAEPRKPLESVLTRLSKYSSDDKQNWETSGNTVLSGIRGELTQHGPEYFAELVQKLNQEGLSLRDLFTGSAAKKGYSEDKRMDLGWCIGAIMRSHAKSIVTDSTFEMEVRKGLLDMLMDVDPNTARAIVSDIATDDSQKELREYAISRQEEMEKNDRAGRRINTGLGLGCLIPSLALTLAGVGLLLFRPQSFNIPGTVCIAFIAFGSVGVQQAWKMMQGRE